MLYLGYENLDRDRLLRANLHSMYPRGQGRTFKFMMHMLSCAYVCDDGSRYLYIGENQWLTKDLARNFHQVLLTEGFEVDYRDDVLKMRVNGSPNHQVDFYFGPPTSSRRFFEGPRWTDIFIDLTDDTRRRYHRDLYELSHKVE